MKKSLQIKEPEISDDKKKQEKDSKKKIKHIIKEMNRSRLNEPIRSAKWSEQLKGNNILIDGNMILSTQRDRNSWQFILLNAEFSRNLKKKQSWKLKMTNNEGWITVGICLKKKIIEYNFTDDTVLKTVTGHGMYTIFSAGSTSSHSSKEFDPCNDSFKFGTGDVIMIEYDPIELKLRFVKNESEYFEMPIILPPQDDAYCPCVELYSSPYNSESVCIDFS